MEITKELLEEVVKNSETIAECLTKFGLAISRNSYFTFKKRIKKWGITIDHFKSHSERMKKLGKLNELPNQKNKISTKELLIENSDYNRSHLKIRLFKEGLKQNICELCGQGEVWQEKKMHLILDHINGVRNDNRLENLRIVCPNCDATLDTFGSKNIKREIRFCPVCNQETKNKKYCGHKCASIGTMKTLSNLRQRKTERPSFEQLKNEINEFGWVGTGKKYGVTDNTIRKWVKYYEKYSI